MSYAEKKSEQAGIKEEFKSEEFEAVWSGQGDPAGTTQGDLHGDLSVDETANLLGITTKAVIKRLQRGSLPGHKIEVKGVQQWRVLHGDWTRDAHVQSQNEAVDPEGSPTGSTLSREDLNEVLAGLEEIRNEMSRPQMMIDRGGEIEDLQRQLIGTQQAMIRMQEDKQLQAVRIAELEGELKLLPDLQSKTIAQAAEFDKLVQENKELCKALSVAREEIAAVKAKKWWQWLLGTG